MRQSPDSERESTQQGGSHTHTHTQISEVGNAADSLQNLPLLSALLPSSFLYCLVQSPSTRTLIHAVTVQAADVCVMILSTVRRWNREQSDDAADMEPLSTQETQQSATTRPTEGLRLFRETL